jgi:hypothetical protein
VLPVLDATAEPDPERIVVTHHQELRDPEKYRFACVMQGSWRLVLRNDVPPARAEGAAGAAAAAESSQRFELYDVRVDPGQTRNRSTEQPARVATLRAAYEAYWRQMSTGFDKPAEIVIGDERAPTVELTCFERLGSQQWGQQAVRRGFAAEGPWLVHAAHPGRYAVTLRRWPAEVDRPITSGIEGGEAISAKEARLRVGDFDRRQPIAADDKTVSFEVPLKAGSHQIEASFLGDDGTVRGAYYATIRRLE